ncbi:TPM domain-containing protein [Mesorhizobium sp. RP14(2022)]|uniref:TPM domain-containing protein n=1 Tax=Mesorhizobium liriopis TaxID=2953882 RepID=A0ABT1C8Q6_9HYPH|nr:TPM domain-containing protein [Mesorhizobium liriopis]MCO6051204.1 TPM domain-containing protein [Mesorhizobium liriopis]
MARALSDAEHRRIAESIRQAETATSGEIVCVVARASGDYFFPAATTALLVVLGAGFVVSLFLSGQWIVLDLPLFALAQIAAALCLLFVLACVPRLRLRFTLPSTRLRLAHDNARRQFLARNMHRTEAHTGVLIFVSLAERYAEVLADSGIHTRVPGNTWNDLIEALLEKAHEDRLADGLVEAVGEVGRHLAQHFPPTQRDRNELPDHVVEI